MGKKIDLNLPVLGLFIFLALFFYYPIFFGKFPLNGNLLVSFWFPWNLNLPFKFLAVDELREFYPLFDFTYQSLRNGSLPFWNPYQFSGIPILANWAGAVFYPLNLIFFFLNNLNSYLFLKISAIILSGYFTYLYLRSIKIDNLSGFLGGLAFSLSSVMLIWEAEIWQSAHTFLYLPLVLWAIEKMINEKKFIFALIGSLGLAMSILAGYTQTTIYVYLLSFSYAFLKLWKKDLKTGFKVFFMFGFSLSLSAIHTLPALEFFLLSPRKEIALTQLNLDFLLPLNKLITFFVPDFFGHIATLNWFDHGPGQYYEQMIYVGVIPIVLSFLAIFHRKLRSYVIFFFLWGLVSLGLVFDLPTSRLVYYSRIPYLSTALAIRIIFVTCFSFSVLAAIGFQWWIESKKEWKKLLLPLIIFSLIYVFIFLTVKNTVSLRNFFIPVVVFMGMAVLLVLGNRLQKLKKHFAFLITVLLIAHSFLFAQKYLAFSSKNLIYPVTPAISYLQKNLGNYRFWGYGKARVENNFATVFKIQSFEGYDPVNLKRYNELLSSVDQGKFTGIASRSDALITNTDISPLKDAHLNRLRMLDLLGVKLVLYQKNNDEKIIENERFKPVWQKDNLVIFENKKAFPRAFLVPEGIYAKSKEEAIKTIFDPRTDLAGQVVLEQTVKNIGAGKPRPGDKTKIVSYTPNKIVIKTTTEKPQFLVLTDSFYPAWTAKVDNKPTVIYPANHAFRAVVVPSGVHEIVFEYRSKLFLMGAVMSIISLAVLIGLIWNKRLN